jgi:hypothetical protein
MEKGVLKMKKSINVCFLLMFLLMGTPVFVKAQTITWMDSFIEGQSPTVAQCQAWHDFLNQLTPDKDFVSVTISGTFDPNGITITDSAVVKEIANLLYTRTAGSLTSDGHIWYIDIGCNLDSCVPSGKGIELRVDALGFCNCPSQGYTVRPDIGNESWGGINTRTCEAPSQTMIVEFCYGECLKSDSSPTVIIDGCDSGVGNTLLSSGSTISDQIAECADDSSNHGRFVSCVAHRTNRLKHDGVITGKEKGAILRCAAKADIP